MTENPSTARRWLNTAAEIVAIVLVISIAKAAIAEPYYVPSGSMEPTLLIGDQLLATKYAYGYSAASLPSLIVLPTTRRVLDALPERGDVVVFRLPRDRSQHYVKRVIGLPGDEIAVRDGVLYINGQAVPKVRKDDFVSPEEGRPIPRFEETLPNGVKYLVLDSVQGGTFDNVSGYRVPPGHYFMMGDNRDNSTDSREQSPRYGVGYVPYENLVGRAEVIFFSAAVDDPSAFRLTRPWTWPFDIRWGRIFSLVR